MSTLPNLIAFRKISLLNGVIQYVFNGEQFTVRFSIRRPLLDLFALNSLLNNHIPGLDKDL